MTNPRRISRLAFIAVMLVTTMAFAGGRKRIVVLDLEGPKAEKFHDDIVSILKKSHIVVPTAKWNSTAEFLDAAAASDGNYKKIAKKLKVDAIVTGKIEKRRDEYIIRLKVRAGTSGEVVGNGVDTKAEGPRVDGKSSKDIKEELLAQIEQLEGGHSGGSPASEDDEDDKPVAKAAPTVKKDDPKKKVAAKKSSEDDEDDAPPAKKTPPPPPVKKEDPKKKVAAKKASEDDDEDDAPAKKAPAKKEDPKKKVVASKKASEDDEDDAPAKKAPAKKASEDDEDTKKSGDDEDGKKKVASADEDSSGDTSVAKSAGDKPVGAEMLTPAHRGADVVVGLAVMQRKFSFTSTLPAETKPPGYQGAFVPAAYIDATLYPLGLSHNGGTLGNLGIGGTFERVLGLQSQITNPDGTQVKEPTTQQRYEIDISYRIPFASGGMAAIKVGYGSQSFKITHGADATVDIPDVNYTGVVPSVLLRYPLGAKLYLNVDVGAMLLTSAGEIQNNDQYGQATALGISGELGIDYMLTKNLFARVSGRYETMGLTFKGTGLKSTSRDMDPMTQDVSAARDNYLGGSITVGYAY